MPKTQAATIKRVIGATLTSDGKHMLMRVERPNGEEAKLAFSIGDVTAFPDLAAVCLDKAEKMKGRPKNQRRQPFIVKSYDLGVDRQSNDAVLYLTFGTGGTLGFRFDPSLAEQLSNGLAVYSARRTPPPPKKSQN
jgi:hypothetical protein